MKLTLRDLENMPQVEKFIKGGGVPSKNKFIRLFREYLYIYSGFLLSVKTKMSLIKAIIL